MKNAIIITLAVISIIGVAVALFFLQNVSYEHDRLTQKKEELNLDLETSIEDLEDSQSEAAELEIDISTLSGEIDQLLLDIEEQTGKSEGLSAELEELQTGYDQLLALNECGEDLTRLDADFSSNDTLLASLIDWYEDNYRKVIGGEWYTLWRNYPTLLIELDVGSSFDYFVITFDPRGGWGNILYLKEQCWLVGGHDF